MAPKRTRRPFRLAPPRRPARLRLHGLEDRVVPVVQPLSLADSSLYGLSGQGTSSHPSISADGQLVAFTSTADNLAPNDTDDTTDAFVYNHGTGTVKLVSVGVDGNAAGIDAPPVISPDGRYVVFESGGSGPDRPVLPGLTGDQLYLRDLSTRTTTLLTASVTGPGGGNRGSFDPIFSADGHHLAFLSGADNLVAGFTYDHSAVNVDDVFERDLTTGLTTLVTQSLDGTSGVNGPYGPYGLSADGRFVAFESSATNLTALNTQNQQQIYVRDTVAGVTQMVSVNFTGQAGAGGHNHLNTDSQVISADGRYVVFYSNATDIVGPSLGTGGASYVRDLRTGTTVAVSTDSTGTIINSNGSGIISPDGLYAAFATSASNVVGLPTGGKTNVYVRNLQTGAVSLASVNAAGTGGGNDNSGVDPFFDFPGGLEFSPDGRYLAFRSLATDLTPGVTTSNRNLYLRDLNVGTTLLVSSNDAGTDGGNGDTTSSSNSGLNLPAFSGDSRIIAFDDLSGNLTVGDNNQQEDVFVRDLSARATALASPRTALLPAAYPATNGGSVGTASADGRYVVITSHSSSDTHPDLAPGVTFTGTGGPDGIYVLDRQTGAVQVVDVNPAGQEVGGLGLGTAGGAAPLISADGRYVAFLSAATDLVTGVNYTPQARNIFVRDLVNHTTVIASVSPNGDDLDASSFTNFVMTPDGRYVAFLTYEPQRIPGVTDPAGNRAVILRDLQANTTMLVSHDLANDGQINGDCDRPIRVSDDGRYVAFADSAPDLVANDTNNAFDVFRWDRTTGQVALVSVNTGGTGAGNADSAKDFAPAMSSDGRYIAFDSSATDLVNEDPLNPLAESVFVRDMSTGATSLAAGSTSDVSFAPCISADGSDVALLSKANLTDLSAGLYRGGTNVYAVQSGGSPVLVSEAADSGTGNDLSGGVAPDLAPLLSPDGRYVAFWSGATNLVAGYTPGYTGTGHADLFLRDLSAGTTKLLAYNQSGTAGGNDGFGTDDMAFSGDGSTVFFDTNSSDLFAGDRNYQSDVFAESTAGLSSIAGRVFDDANGNGIADGGEAGRPYWTAYLDANGNGQLDAGETSVQTDAQGNYAFEGLTPGTYTVTVVPQSGYTLTAPGAGSYSLTIATDGTAVAGKDFGAQLPLADLATSAVSFVPASAGPGQSVSVSWQVTNHGTAAAAGSWADAIYLSPTPTLGAGSRLLTTVAHSGGLAVNGQYTGNAVVPLPPTPGTWYVVVRADYRGQVDEGAFQANKADNVAASASTLDLGIPTLVPDTPAAGTFSGPGSGCYYQIAVTPGQTLTIALASTALIGTDELYVRRGALPDPATFDFTARSTGQPNQTVTVPTTAGGTYYVFARTVSGVASTADFTLTAHLPAFGITSIGLASGGNTGRVTIPIHGTLLTTNTQARLIDGPVVLPAVSVDFPDASTLYATFDLTGQPVGAYDVQLVDGALQSTDPGTFAVVPGTNPYIGLSLSVPSKIRVGSTDGTVLRYTNVGNTDALAPLITLSADYAVFTLPDEPYLTGASTQILGISADGPAGILRPGESGQVTIPLKSTANALQDIHFTTSIATDTAAMDWTSIKGTLRPDDIPADAWDAIYGNFTATVGGTVGSYHAALAAGATYLGDLGERTDDVARLLSFEFNKADAVFTSQTLTTVVDASFPAPGMPLTFVRQFQQSLTGRYTVGPFGRGWTDNWNYDLEVDGAGNVEIHVNGIGRYFAKKSDGSYAGSNGDRGILSRTNRVYQLHETDGTITAFNPDGTLNYVQDSNGNRITAGYTNGLLTTLTHSDGDKLTITYVGLTNQIQSVTDPGGRTVTYGYDPTGQHLTTFSDKYGTTFYSYQTGQTDLALNNALTQIAYSDNTHIFFGYDTFGRLVDQHRDNDQEDVLYTYGSAGGYTVADADNGAATYRIDDAGQLREAVNALGQEMRYSYDANRQLTGENGPLGASVSFSYDGAGNITSTLDPLGNRVDFTYDTAHHLTSYTDAKGNTTQYRPDAAGDLLSITYPTVNGQTSSQQFQYDPVGDMTESINARGQAMSDTYYPNGQLQQTTFADNTTQKYQYDAHGNVTQVTDRQGGITAMHYDAADNLTEIDYPGGKFLKFQYNGVGQRTQSVDQDGFTINYGYDALGRLGTLTDGSGNPIAAYTYTPAGRLAEKDLGNGTYTVYAYDKVGNILQIVNRGPRPSPGVDGPINSEFDYTYDALDRVATATTPDGQWVYTYDADSQFTHAVFTPNATSTLSAQDLEYDYDAAGNRTQTIINGVTTPYTVDARNEYTQVGGTAYTYDADGNLATATTGGATTTYNFDQLNELTGISSPTDTWNYGYDPFGNRTSATDNGQTTTYEFDPAGLGNMVADFNGAGTLTTHYTYGLGLVSQVPTTGSAGYYDFDLTGNTVGITDSSGAYVDTYAYLPFGAVVASSGNDVNPFTFVGEAGVTGDSSGLVSMRMRDYDSTTGEFLSNDPLNLAGGDTNLRRYANNEPTNRVDPSGLCDQKEDPALKSHRISQLKHHLKKLYDLAAGRAVDKRGDFADLTKEQSRDAENKLYELLEKLDKAYDPDYQKLQNLDSEVLWDLFNAQEGDPPNTGAGAGSGTGSGNSGCPCGCPPGAPPGCTGSAGQGGTSQSVGGFDPNELIGPAGFGTQAFVGLDQPLPYAVGFENDPTKATAAAQVVTVTEQLDPNLDWSTFELGAIDVGSTAITVPAGLQTFSTTYHTTNVDQTPLLVTVNAGLDLQTGVVTWTFNSLDPATGLTPDDPVAGFLPVDDSTGRGQAFVHYTIRVRANTPSLTPINALATVVFDTNPALSTQTVTNTVDAGTPTSLVGDLPDVSPTLNFPISWSGSDQPNESGVAGFNVYVSDNGGPWTTWLMNTPNLSATFTGLEYHQYAFYSQAVDKVGNVEPFAGTIEDQEVATTGDYARADVYGADAGKTLKVAGTAGVMANDLKKKGRKYTARVVTPPAHGTLSLAANGGFTYKPDSTFVGIDSFTYQMRDDTGKLGNVATVTLASRLVSFRKPTVSVRENAGTGTLQVDLRLPATAVTTVDYVVAPGTATAGVDFTLAGGTLTFQPGEKSKTIQFAVADDQLNELPETFRVTLENPVGAVLGKTPTTTVTIKDNDPKPTIGFASTTSAGDEGTANEAIEVKLSTPSGRTVTVHYAVPAGKAGGTATNGTDYNLAAGTLTFAPGETSKLIDFTVIDDAQNEPNETIVVKLSKADGAKLTSSKHTFTILDNDPPPSVAFSAATASVHESAGGIDLTVALAAPSGQPVSVEVAVSGGTARAGTDYRFAPVVLSFSPGETTKTVHITILRDPAADGDETVLFGLTNPTNATLGATGGLTLTIQDG